MEKHVSFRCLSSEFNQNYVKFTKIETFNGVLEKKDRYSLLLFRYSPEGNIFVVRETKIFSLRIVGDYELAI